MVCLAKALYHYFYVQDFKLNPNAQSFTPSSCSTRASTPVAQHPLVAQSPVYMHSIVHGGTVIQGSPMNLQTIPQQNQLSPYNPAVASAVVAVSSTAYMSSPGGPVPGFPVGVGGGGLLPGQPNTRVPPHSQQQVVILLCSLKYMLKFLSVIFMNITGLG